MKTIVSNSETYGIINYVEVAGVDYSKINDSNIKINPSRWGYSKQAGEDIRCESLDKNNNVSDREKKDYHFFYNSVFYFPLENANKDWHIINKNFAAGNDFLVKMIKEKTCPISVSDADLMKWFIDIYPYLNDDWKAQNLDYMKIMDEKILLNNNRMLDGFRNQNMKEVRISIKLGADINYHNNDQSPLNYALEYQNKDLLNYLINKHVIIPENLIINHTNILQDIVSEYQKKQKKKILKFK